MPQRSWWITLPNPQPAVADATLNRAQPWKRLRNRSSSNGRDDRSFDDRPRRKGLVITVCILISVVLWFTLTMRETYSIEVEMPTEVVNLPPDEALVALPPRTVDVQVEGEGFQLLRLFYDLPPIPINAATDEVNLDNAVYTVPALSQGVSVTSMTPSGVVLRKGPRVTRKVPVRLHVDVQMPSTHDLTDSLRVVPDSVEVSGAASIVDSLKAWPTVRRTFEDVRDSLDVLIPLADTLRGLVERSADVVRLVAHVEPFTEGLRDVDVIVRSAPSGGETVTLEQPTVRVRYRVPLSQYARSQETPELFATVSYEAIRADNTGRVRPELHVPPGLLLRDVEIEPSTLSYYTVLVDE